MDVSFLQFNPAASSIQKETQLSLFHNQWIADSKMETAAFTTRNKNLGIGAYISCFYLPFTEYNLFGERAAGSYYTETTGGFNISYNFLAGYNFKGIALGATIKGGWRGMPDYTDNNTNAIIANSGLEQSGLALMADFGDMLQFNFLKFFASRTPNVRIGLSAQNLGASITGFGSSSGIKIDDPLPTYFAAGLSCQFLPIITATFDIKQPVNLFAPKDYQMFSVSAGIILAFTKNFIFSL